MPFDRKEYMKEYRKKNAEKIKQQKNDSMKMRYNDKMKDFYKTPEGIKDRRIANWKKRGVKHNNYDELYEYYLSVSDCESCSCELDKCNKSRKCLDHNHTNGEFRNVICHSCNVLRN